MVNRNIQDEDKGLSTSTGKVAKKSKGKKNISGPHKPNIIMPGKSNIQQMFEDFQNDFSNVT
ncbi:hypothetical protein JVT61DRAFT_13538 [Boletus reticuloceps]|uniref:Uncharacterized protein n=1 Tax=Boletus reticuloceps TaxID=495285 RepID=A0A8I2YDB0_9AGAM|nr:hypothetical protein JVT61DRAFT_13538 [Boletus reticuloceps]